MYKNIFLTLIILSTTSSSYAAKARNLASYEKATGLFCREEFLEPAILSLIRIENAFTANFDLGISRYFVAKQKKGPSKLVKSAGEEIFVKGEKTEGAMFAELYKKLGSDYVSCPKEKNFAIIAKTIPDKRVLKDYPLDVKALEFAYWDTDKKECQKLVFTLTEAALPPDLMQSILTRRINLTINDAPLCPDKFFQDSEAKFSALLSKYVSDEMMLKAWENQK